MTQERITIVDVSARDGLQNEAAAVNLSAEDKVTFISKLAEAGFTRIEGGSFVHPKAVPAMANSGDVAVGLQPVSAAHPHVIFSWLVPNPKGLERAKSIGAKEVAIFLAMSEEFSRANINAGVDESFTAIEPTIKAALAEGMRVRGYISNVFGYGDEAVSPAEVARRSKQLLDMGCFEVSLGDTTGIGKPDQVAALMQALKEEGIPLEKVAMHFHDTFGSAVANVDVAYNHGIRIFDAATGGLGGCPYAKSPKGNLAVEDLLAWCERRGLGHDVSDAAALAQARAFIYQQLGKDGQNIVPSCQSR